MQVYEGREGIGPLFFAYNRCVARVLPQTFFDRPALVVARALLGKALVRRKGDRTYTGVITEVEAYDGPQDRACHAHRGKTPRNEPMFGPAGHWYVYFVYGMHWMLNIVTGRRGYPAAILIRGIRAPDESQYWNGPAKLTKAFQIDRQLNGKGASRREGLWIEDRGVRVNIRDVRRTPRIGVAYAGIWAKKPYRFVWNPGKRTSQRFFT